VRRRPDRGGETHRVTIRRYATLAATGSRARRSYGQGRFSPGGHQQVALRSLAPPAGTRVTNDVGAFLRNQANGRAQAPMKARFPRPTASHPFYSKPHVTPSYFLLFSCETA